jgi:polysaccharide pyruvyl transferase WcaK-like protein
MPFVEPLPVETIARKKIAFTHLFDISGFAYGDNWGIGQMDETSRLIKAIDNDQLKVVFMPQAWGGFTKQGMQVALKTMLSKASHFYARDKTSRDFLATALNLPTSEIAVGTDLAFVFNPKPQHSEACESIMTKLENQDRLVVGVSPNMRMYEKTPREGTENAYFSVLLNYVQYCIQDLKALVVLVPNEIKPQGAINLDDRFICRLIYESTSFNENIFNIDQYHTADEIKAIIGKLNLLVGSRFHALIFALSQGVPSLAISWSHKYKELFDLFDMPQYVLEQEEIRAEVIIDKTTEILANRKSLNTDILSRSGKIKKESKRLLQALV